MLISIFHEAEIGPDKVLLAIHFPNVKIFIAIHLAMSLTSVIGQSSPKGFASEYLDHGDKVAIVL